VDSMLLLSTSCVILAVESLVPPLSDASRDSAFVIKFVGLTFGRLHERVHMKIASSEASLRLILNNLPIVSMRRSPASMLVCPRSFSVGRRK